MDIFPLQQAACEDRSKISSGPSPGNWIGPALPDGWRLPSFHFFVDWSAHPPAVADRIWMTRQLRLEVGESLADARNVDVLRIFRQSPAQREFESLEIACLPYRQGVSAVLLPEVAVCAISDETPVWVITKPAGREYQARKITVGKLKKAIQKHSGGPVRVGSKGLIYGTSGVECYLSKGDAAFPGDVDALVVDDTNGVRHIIEYKKHTLAAPIGEHLITRYYPRPDGRKYQRLAALANRYQKILQRPVPLIVLYYSTMQPVIRLQEIRLLDENRVTISRDTGDVAIEGRSREGIADDIIRWLGVRR